MADIRTCKQYAKLANEKEEAKARLKVIDEKMVVLEPEILSYLENQGGAKVTVDGRTLSIRTETWAAKSENVSWETACDVLSKNGFADMVGPRFNAQSLSASIREMIRDGEEVPAPVAEVLSISTVHKLSVRKS
jgi:hypothetical protein